MGLNAAQNRIIRSKPFGLSVVKGIKGSGKTTAAVHRILYLKNNYCLYEEDGILVVGNDNENVTHIGELYNAAENSNSYEYYTLFSGGQDKVNFTPLQSIVDNYFKDYCRDKKQEYSFISDSERLSTLRRCLDSAKEQYKGCKFFDKDFIVFISEEIAWIKACGYTSQEEYQNADRIGRKYSKSEGPQRLLKNSRERKIIYDIFLSYSRALKSSNLLDREDAALMALKQAKRKGTKKYAHVVIDESQKLTRVQLELIMTLCSNRVYSSMMLVINTEDAAERSTNAWLIKGRKYNTIGSGMTSKTYSLSQSFLKNSGEQKENEDIKTEEQPIISLDIIPEKADVITGDGENYTYEEGAREMESIEASSVENFQYVDIRHFRKYDFVRDPDRIDEVIVKSDKGDEEYSSDYLKELPVYSDIAAGEPILMSSELEANFYIPQYWLKGINDCFILKVRGDSMRDAEINDGDYVVIRKQHTAQNGDIVAAELEGSATLKRLSLGKGGAQLVPENPKYSPIPLYGREATILGIAVGVIKYKN